MATKAEIQERIDFYTKRIEEFGSNLKHIEKKKVSESLLKFWNNQLIHQQKEGNRKAV